MGNSSWDNALDPFPSVAGAAFGTFTTNQDVSPVPLPTVYGNELRPGSKVYCSAHGEFSTTGTPTLALGFTYGAVAGAAGGVNLALSSAITTGSGAAAWPWYMVYEGTVLTVGASGTIIGGGVLYFGTALTTYSVVPIPITQALRTVTIDTTVAKLIGVCATYGTSSGSNTVKVNGFTARIPNQGKTS